MELKTARSVLAMIRRDQSQFVKEKAEVGVDQDEDPTAEDETNIHTVDHPGDGQEVTVETDTTAVDGAPDLHTAGRDIPVRDTPAQDQDPGGEIARRKLKIDITE